MSISYKSGKNCFYWDEGDKGDKKCEAEDPELV
jgi:hypothetical protein